MKNRWIGGLVLAMAVALGACAPPGQGGGSDEPSAAPSTAAESEAPESVQAEPSTEASPAPPAPSYDFDY